MNESFDLKRTLSYTFIAAIALLFALQWGPGSVGCGKRGGPKTLLEEHEYAATVNGKEVPMKRFRDIYYSQLARYKSQGMTAAIAKQLGLHTQVIEHLVDAEVIAQAAEARGIVASDQEIIDILKRDPQFKNKDGKFDLDTYKAAMTYERRTPEDFEAEVRRALGGEKLLQIVEQGAVVSDDEVKTRYFKDYNKANVTFVKLSPTGLADKVKAPKAGEVDAWAAKNEAAIADYYKANQKSFFQDQRAHVRQILVRALKDDPIEKHDAARAKADVLQKEIVGGKDFATVAKAESDDAATKEKGGDLGYVEPISLPRELSEAVFHAKVGDVTPVIETGLGYFVAKIEDLKPAETKPLESVKKEIAEQLWRREQAQALVKIETDKALAGLKAGKKLTELFPKPADDSAGQFAAPTGKPVATETGDFNAAAVSVPQLGVAPEIIKSVFAMDAPGTLEQPFNLNGDTVLVVVTDRHKPTDAEYETQKAQLTTEAIKGKQYELKDAFTKSLRKQAAVVTNNNAIEKATEG
jgi:peptidyl-prolyl cis-trans isomerase D